MLAERYPRGDSFTERGHKKKNKKDHSILDAAVTVDVGKCGIISEKRSQETRGQLF